MAKVTTSNLPSVEKRSVRAKLEKGGRIVIPARCREAMGVKPGDELLVFLEEDGTVRVMSLKIAVLRAQALIRQYIPEGRLLSEELIQERRKEAASE